MSITLEALEQALAPIEEIGKGEITFPVNGVDITLAILLPEVENLVQKFAAEPVAGPDGDDETSALDYLERFKVEIISHAIVQVGSQDLRGVEVIETGEELPNKKKVKLPRADALRSLVLKWSRGARTGVFRKYSELIGTVEKQAEKAIEFEPADLDAEIERLENVLERLRAEKKARETPEDATLDFAAQVKLAAEADAESASDRQSGIAEQAIRKSRVGRGVEPTEDEPEAMEDEAPEPEPVPAGPRQSIIPQQAAPPQQQAAPPARPATPVKEATPPVPQEPVDLLAGVRESLVDPGDEEGMRDAVEAENARLMAMRQGRAPQDGSVVTPGRRRPPHAGAAEAAAALAEQAPDPEAILGAQEAQRVGERDGKEVFRLPTEELATTAADRTQNPGEAPPINTATGRQGTSNPRFRPPKTGP